MFGGRYCAADKFHEEKEGAAKDTSLNAINAKTGAKKAKEVGMESTEAGQARAAKVGVLQVDLTVSRSCNLVSCSHALSPGLTALGLMVSALSVLLKTKILFPAPST